MVLAVSIVNGIEAGKIEKALYDTCYLTEAQRFVYASSIWQDLYMFDGDGCSHAVFSYENSEHTLVSSASLQEGDFSVKLSLFGDHYIWINGSRYDLAVDSSGRVVSINGKACYAISREDAEALYAKNAHAAEVYPNVRCTTLGIDTFVSELNGNFSDSSSSGKGTNDQYINAAKGVISGSLKDPTSAIWNEAYVVETDSYGRAIVYVDVSATNSFGGYVRDAYYVCIQSITGSSSDGVHYQYNPNFAFESADGSYSLSVLKSLNGFGENPNAGAEISAKKFKVEEAGEAERVTVEGIELDRYILDSKNVTYVVYLDPDVQCVVAAEMVMDASWYKNRTEDDIAALKKLMNTLAEAVGYIYLNTNYQAVLPPETGSVRSTPYIDGEGTIFNASKSDQYYRYAGINGAYFGFTEDDYWSPIDEEVPI